MVCLVVNIFPSIQRFDKWLSAEKKCERLEQQTFLENEYAKCFMWHFLALVSDF